MRKLLLSFLAVVSVLCMTSCEDDEIARTLDGIWRARCLSVVGTHTNMWTYSSQEINIQLAMAWNMITRATAEYM